MGVLTTSILHRHSEDGGDGEREEGESELHCVCFVENGCWFALNVGCCIDEKFSVGKGRLLCGLELKRPQGC
jgi:hypothetical protein